MLDPTKLQAFLFAAQSLSFSEAARHLNLSQPTISHHIKGLEQDLGVELFHRSGSKLKLTEAGHLLLPWARRIMHESVEVQQMLGSLHERIAGHIRIACSTTTGKYILPQFAGRFRAQHPNVQISILACTQVNVIPRLLREEADLGVVSYDACGGEFECQDFFADHIILIAAREHPWASRDCIDLSELLDVPFIVREETAGTRRVMLAELGKHDITLDDMNIFLEVGNAEAIVKMVELNFGVSFVSRSAASWAINNGTVVEVPVHGVDLRYQIYMIRPEMYSANRAVEAFWASVHDPVNIDLLRLSER
ncbi:MAG: LysR family transcriptional regulator [Anaerolineae bacterium]|nr:LysR family transcriptional regulator [Anaerolineae bacterium]